MRTALLDRRSDAAWLGIAVAGSAIAISLCLTAPMALLYLVLAAVFAVAINSAFGRLAFVVCGGMVVLQSNGTGLKLAYSAGVLVCVIWSFNRMIRIMRRQPEVAAFRAVLVTGFVLVLATLISAAVAHHNGIGLLAWFREAQPYLLLGVLPPVGVDAGASSTPKQVRTLVLIIGVIAPIAFLTDWLHRRGASSLPIDRFAFASIPLCAILLGYALSHVAHGKSKIRWAFVAAVSPAAVLLTGSRSSLALVVAILGVVGATRKFRLPPRRALATGLIVAGAMYWVIPVLGPKLVNDQTFYTGRLSGISEILTGNTAALSTDQSVIGRQYQTQVTLDAFKSHPLTGNGPGYVYPDTTSLDTPLAVLARLGLLGAIPLFAYLVAWVRAARKFRRIVGYSRELTAARVFLVAMILYLPLGSVFDDKGLSLAATLFAALIVSGRAKLPSDEAAPLATRTKRVAASMV